MYIRIKRPFYCSVRAREIRCICKEAQETSTHFLNYYYPVMCMRNTKKKKTEIIIKKKLNSSLKEVKKQVNNNKMSVL